MSARDTERNVAPVRSHVPEHAWDAVRGIFRMGYSIARGRSVAHLTPDGLRYKRVAP